MDEQESVPVAFGLNYDSAMFQRNGSANDLKRTSDSVRSIDLIFGMFLGTGSVVFWRYCQTTGTTRNFLHTGKLTMQQSGTLVQHFDVAILGSGVAGGLMSCILARQGLKVVIIDTGTHPRFAPDKSTLDETTYMLRILAERYDVPEIAHCIFLSDVRQHVTSVCGIKRNFGFVYHKDKIQNPNEVTQCNVSEFPFSAQMHYYRQNIDVYLLHSAIKYGAVAKQHTQVETVKLHSQGVTIATDTGEKFEVAYVVDGSGDDSVLARQFNLREHPSRFKPEFDEA